MAVYMNQPFTVTVDGDLAGHTEITPSWNNLRGHVMVVDAALDAVRGNVLNNGHEYSANAPAATADYAVECQIFFAGADVNGVGMGVLARLAGTENSAVALIMDNNGVVGLLERWNGTWSPSIDWQGPALVANGITRLRLEVQGATARGYHAVGTDPFTLRATKTDLQSSGLIRSPGIRAYSKQADNTKGMFITSVKVEDLNTALTAGPAPTLTAVSSTQIDVSWAEPTGGVPPYSYTVQRGAVGFVEPGTTIYSGTARSVSDTGLTASTTYEYLVKATDSA